MERADSLVGAWCQVAGGLEEGETAWQAALREITEETGLTPQRFYSGDICEQFYEPERDCISIFPVFVAFVDPTAWVTLNNEHSAYQWLDFDAARAGLILGAAPHLERNRSRVYSPHAQRTSGNYGSCLVKKRCHLRHNDRVFIQCTLHKRAFFIVDLCAFGLTLGQCAIACHIQRRCIGLL